MSRQGIQKLSGQFRVVMVRHGESEWNQKNLFCGWYDAHLSDRGKNEARNAGKRLKQLGYSFDYAFSSVLTRAKTTLALILEELGLKNLEKKETWRLNERHYGALTGLNKVETVKKYGDEQVNIWRRSFDIPPPPMGKNHPHYNNIVNDKRYADGPKGDQFPMTESLKLTIDRTMPFWKSEVLTMLKQGKQVIIVAHGNSLRGIIKELEEMGADQIMKLNLPTGIPFMYTLNEKMKPIEKMKFLADPETVRKAIEEVASQTKKKM